MSSVHAPYHFVPLSKWVYMPDWAHLVSHDHPFEDGHSGVIEYTLTNHTPLCVGSDKVGNLVKFARDPKGNPVVPGSSLKGMIRNVLEIASFGKFSAVDDQRFSYRDFRSESYKSQMENIARTISGWLKFDDGKWVFTETQNIPIFMDELNTYAKTRIDPSKHGFKAIDAYKQHPINNEISFDISRREFIYNHPEAKGQSVESARLNPEGKNKGNIVFSNFRISITPQKNNVKNGKLRSRDITDFDDKKTVKLRTGFSYVFYNNGEVIQFDNLHDEYQYLLSQYSEDDLKTIMPPEHEKYGIPIFAHVDAGNRLIALSFSKMPKFKYNKSIINMIDSLSKLHGSAAYFDMAELMFGTLRESGLGLKSRVFFSDAAITSSQGISVSQSVVLSSPKPSFLAAYIEQPKVGEYASYGYKNEQEVAKLSGWKRYPVKREFTEIQPPNDNENVQVRLEVLSENSTFSGRIAFHNLKQEELAALIWALTLNGSRDHYHTLGHGKSLGAGAVQFEVKLDPKKCYNNSGDFGERSIFDWVDLFVAHMNEQLDRGEWLDTPQLKHLLALSDELISDENKFSAHKLEDFKSIKEKKYSLDPLSYNGTLLSRTNQAPERSGSLAFAKGRLSGLIDKDSNLYQELSELSQSKQVAIDKKLQKQEMAKAAEALQDAPTFERSLGLLENIVLGQDGATASFKKEKAKEIRTITKELKQETLQVDEVKSLLLVVSKINIAEKDVQKLDKWLQTQ